MNARQAALQLRNKTKFDAPALFRLVLRPSSLVMLMIIAFAVFFGALAVRQHQAFLTHGLDIGNVDQALWNTAQGRFLQFTLMAPAQSRLALHVEPILLAFVPFYWVGLGSPELLLIVQAAVVALGAWPLYQIAALQLCSVTSRSSSPPPAATLLPATLLLVTLQPATLLPCYLATLIALAYLLLPTLQSAVLFDFHAVTFAPTFLLFAFLALERRNNARFLIFILLAMACKEDMPLVAALLGLYVGLAQKRWRLAVTTIALSLLWFGLAFFVIQPWFAAGGNIQLDRYAWLGDDPLSMLVTLITQPGLVFEHLWTQVNLPTYIFNLFYPTAFLALFSPLTLLPMLPTLAVNLLSDNPFTWRLEDFHYGAPLAPFLFISAVYGIRRIANGREAWRMAAKRSERRMLLLVLLLLLFSLIYHYHRGFTPLARPFEWPEVTAHHRQLKTILAAVPADSPVFAQSNLAPHLTHRPTIYSDFGYFTDPDFPAQAPVDIILLDVTSFENIGGLHQFLKEQMAARDDYRLVAATDGILSFEIDRSSQGDAAEPGDSASDTNPQSSIFNLQSSISNLQSPFYTFTQPDSPLDYYLSVDFGQVVRLHGYSLHFNRQEEVQVTVDLEALQPLESIQPVLYLLDAQGQPLGATTDLQPTLVWYPVEQWPVGERVRVRFNTLPWYTRDVSAYRLALGVIQGSDVWAVDSRFPPQISHPTELAPRLPAGGALVELAQIEQIWSMPTGGPRRRQFDQPYVPNEHQADFDNQIRLLGYELADAAAESASITLYWQAITSPENLVRFVQWVGPDGVVYGQQDSAPDHGQYPTHLWQPGEVVIETVTFPIQSRRPAGSNTLHIGWYHPETGERLQLYSGGDHVELAVEE